MQTHSLGLTAVRISSITIIKGQSLRILFKCVNTTGIFSFIRQDLHATTCISCHRETTTRTMTRNVNDMPPVLRKRKRTSRQTYTKKGDKFCKVLFSLLYSLKTIWTWKLGTLGSVLESRQRSEIYLFALFMHWNLNFFAFVYHIVTHLYCQIDNVHKNDVLHDFLTHGNGACQEWYQLCKTVLLPHV